MMSISKLSILCTSILFPFLLMAQPPAPPATPIDGGLGLLLAGGAAYGIRKLAKRRQSND